MKKNLIYFFCALLLSCTPEKENLPKKITLTADKITAIADGEDFIQFSVNTDDNKDVTAESQFFINNKLTHSHTFSSEEAGEFSVVAKYKNIQSSPLIVTFSLPVDERLQISSSKNTFVADGVDRIVLSCVVRGGNIGDNVIIENKDILFFVNGEQLEGNIFKTDKEGTYTITALYDNKQIPEITVTAVNDFQATNKLFVELFAATWCPHCPRGIFLLNELSKDQRIVPLAYHPFERENGHPLLSGQEAYNLFYSLNLEYIPAVIVNHDKNTFHNELVLKQSIEDFLPYLSDDVVVGIAAECDTLKSDYELQTDIYVTAKNDLPDVNLVAILAENNLVADQKNTFKPELGNPIRNHVHNHIYRAADNGFSGETISLTAGTPLHKTISFSVEGSEWKRANCDIIILVTDKQGIVINAQKVSAGTTVGY